MTSSDQPEASSSLSLLVKNLAREFGFELVGIAPAVRAGTWEQLDDWLDRGFAGQMHYLERRRHAYQHPEHVLPVVRSVVMLGLVYGSGGLNCTRGEKASPQLAPAFPKIARYAQGSRDYHEVIREKLKQFSNALHQIQPGCRTRGVVDTAPLLERDFARLAGLGWFGKNTLLINKQLGSELFLAALLTDLELDPDEPHQTQHCGSCTRCLDACPTNAFVEPYVLDATKCISYLTIELRNAPIPMELRPGMDGWLFGCDVCQTVCPWNRKAPATRVEDFRPDPQLSDRTLSDWLTITQEDFERVYSRTPLARPGWQGVVRNACIAAAQTHDARLLPSLKQLTNHPDAVIRDAASWALDRIGSGPVPAAEVFSSSAEEITGH